MKKRDDEMMRRPVSIIAISYILGIYMQYQLTIPIKIILFGLLIVLAMLTLFMYYNKNHILVISVGILLLGALNFQANHSYISTLEPFFEKEVYIVGDVLDVSYGESLKITIVATQVKHKERNYAVYDKFIAKIKGEYNSNQDLVGKRIGLYGTLYEPMKKRNPKLFDYNLYLKSKRIYGTFYGSIEQVNFLGEGKIPFLFKWAHQIKNRITLKIMQILPEAEGRMFLGILLGDKEGLDEDTYESFRQVGVAHVLAVSGLHVGIVYLSLNAIFKSLSQKIRIILIILVLCFYAIITGCAPSVIRATFMAVLLLVAPLLDRKYDSISAITFTALVLLFMNPLLLMSIGFQFSFSAVLSIALFYKPIYRKLKYIPEFWAQIIAASLAAQVGMMPIIAYHFNYVSPWALLANIPVVLMTGYILPLGLVVTLISFIQLELAFMISKLLFFLINLMIKLTKAINALPFASVDVISPSWFFMIIYYSCLFILVKDRKENSKWRIHKGYLLPALISVYFIIIAFTSMIPGKLEVVFLDVGQGDSILVCTPMGKHILIDGGAKNERIDSGKSILVPYLLKHGIKKLDIMILSHAHNDHIGGLLKVVDTLKVDTLVIGAEDYESEDFLTLKEKAKAVELKKMAMGDRIILEDQIELWILHPTKNPIIQSKDDTNNNSLVALLTYKSTNLLFTGDIQEEAEREIINNHENLKVDILKVPHHGSRFSSTDEFIKHIKPKIAIIQVGKNFFGHPHEDVLNRFEGENTKLFRNDINGAVKLWIENKGIRVKTMY